MAKHHEETSEAKKINGYAANVDERNNHRIGQRLNDVAFWEFVNLVVLRVPHALNIAPIG